MKKIFWVACTLGFLSSCGLQVRDHPSTGTGGSSDTSLFTVGGSASGIPTHKNVVLNVAGQSYPISQNGAFTFPISFTFNQAYNVDVGQGPGGAYTCSLQNDSGTVRGNVNNVLLNCVCSNGVLGAGSGTFEDPANIYTASQLNDIAVSGTKADMKKHYNQVCDLDYTGINPTPIGGETIPFTGIYDGQTFFILHYHSGENVASKEHRKGIFGAISSSGIKNVYISDGILRADSAIGAGYMGMLVGTNFNSPIRDIYAENIIVDDRGQSLCGIGGLVGTQEDVEGYPDSTLESIHMVTMDIYGAKSTPVGGVVGSAKAMINKVEVDDAHIHSCLNNCGGIAGLVTWDWNVQNINAHNVRVEGNKNVGGIVGYNQGYVRWSSFIGEVDGKTSDGFVGGLVGTSVNTNKIQGSYTASDIKSVSGSPSIGAVYGSNVTPPTNVSFDETKICENCASNAGVSPQSNSNGFIAGTDKSQEHWNFNGAWCLMENDYPRISDTPFSVCE